MQQSYWVSEPGQPTKGPVSLSHLEEMEKNNTVSTQAKVCLVGTPDWIDLKKITKSGLIQPATLPQIPPPALPQSAITNKLVTYLQTPTLSNTKTPFRTRPITAIYRLMFGLFLMLLTGSMIFLFVAKSKSPLPDYKNEGIAKVLKVEDVKKTTPARRFLPSKAKKKQPQ